MARNVSLVQLAGRFWQEALAAGVGGALAGVVFSRPLVGLVTMGFALTVLAIATRTAQTLAAESVVELGELREDIARHRQRSTYEDAETGLGTATQLEIAFTKQVARNHRWGEDFSLALLEVNDAYKPDRQLQTVTAASIAQGLLQVARSEDTVCRLDNCTFAVLLAGSSREGADAFVARVRTRVSAVEHPGEHGRVFVTIRAGVSPWQENLGSLSEMLAGADADMRRFERELRRQEREFEADPDPIKHTG